MISKLALVALFVVGIIVGPPSGWSARSTVVVVPDTVVAFPGAEGWGAMALDACRALLLQHLVVSNTNNSGVGSLRQALVTDARSDRYTIITFTTGGTITLSSDIRITASCIYLAGQSAPGGGILIKNNGLRFDGGQQLIRYIRVRLDAVGFKSSIRFIHSDASGATATNTYVDHVSSSWSTDEAITAWRFTSTSSPLEKVTFARSLSTEADVSHSTGMLFGGRETAPSFPGGVGDHEQVYNITVHHNLFATNSQRNPQIAASHADSTPLRGAEVINNVAYNWIRETYNGTHSTVVDIRNNYWKQGPADQSPNVAMRFEVSPFLEPGNPYDPASIYVDGNVSVARPVQSQWNMLRSHFVPADTLPTTHRRFSARTSV